MRWTLFALAALCGCGRDLPNPVIVSFSPTAAAASAAVQLTAQVDAVLPFQLDYGQRSGNVETNVTLWVGPLKIYDGIWPPNSEISGVVPSVLQPGQYDVAVQLEDGRNAVRKSAFTVTPGQWPLSYAFDVIDNQRVGQPFAVHIRAIGGAAASFAGNLTLVSSAGTADPSTTDPFVGGDLVQTVTVRNTLGTVQLTVRDSEGHSGTSNSFQVQ